MQFLNAASVCVAMYEKYAGFFSSIINNNLLRMRSNEMFES